MNGLGWGRWAAQQMGGGGVTGKSPPVMLLPFLPPFQGEAAHIKNTSSRGSLGLERSSGLSFEDV